MAIGMVRHFYFMTGLAGLVSSCAHTHATTQHVNAPGSAAQRPADNRTDHYPPEDVADPAEIKRVTSYFDENLNHLGQRVRSCGGVVRLQVGKDSLIYGRGLAAFGAYCTLGTGQNVVMCYEEAGGRFAIVSGSFSQERPWIVAFTSRTCADH